MSKVGVRGFSTILLAVVVSLFLTGPALAAGNPSATGGGTIEEGGEKSTFTFSAVQLPDSRVVGHLVYHFRALDVTLCAAVDCLDIRGTQAVIGGRTTQEVVVGGTWVIPEGTQIVFAVEDNNGQGGAATPDRVSDVRVDTRYEGPACGETVDRIPYLPLDGNVQVEA